MAPSLGVEGVCSDYVYIDIIDAGEAIDQTTKEMWEKEKGCTMNIVSLNVRGMGDNTKR